jgi:hypothetical protein
VIVLCLQDALPVQRAWVRGRIVLIVEKRRMRYTPSGNVIMCIYSVNVYTWFGELKESSELTGWHGFLLNYTRVLVGFAKSWPACIVSDISIVHVVRLYRQRCRGRLRLLMSLLSGRR